MKTSPRYAPLGEQIRALRAAAGIATQAELAHRLGASQQTVSRWEAGTSRPRANELAKLAATLKIDVTRLSHAAGYTPEATTVSFDRPLPLPSLLPDSFEYFCLDLLSTYLHGKADVHPAGKTGHKQYGIDIEARLENDELYTYQCKRESQFGPDKVKKAIKAQTIDAKKKHILLSRVASPDARSEIRRMRGWDLWDQIDITRIFRNLPKREQVRIADIYFPTQRFALTGELAAGPWQSVDEFFAPLLVDGRPFNNQRWELVGRAAELDDLARALADRSVIAVSLIGRAGEGKSRVLRAALEAYAAQHPEVRMVVASPTEEITAKSLEDLGAGEKLLIVDDVHDRSDLVQLIRYVADARSQARLFLVYRPYWSDVVLGELARYALTGNLIRSITLTKPTKRDGVILATQVLNKLGAPTDAAEAIASAAYDSPLAVVVGAQVVANEGVHPELFASNEVFRTMVLKHYEKVIAQGIAQGKEQDRVHKILRVLALIQPVAPDDKHVLQLLASVEGVEAPDASRLVGQLVDGGVLFKRGARYRLSPDLLADSIIETACITPSGASNGYAERLFSESIPEHKEHVLLNLGRLDWRRNEGDTSESTLLDGLWSQLVWADDYVNAQVKAAAAAAYFQPRQALTLARRLIDEGHGQDKEVCRIIQGATYNLSHLADACSLLWEVGQHDERPTHQHPNHAIRLLTELATPDPRKPIEFVESVVDFALSLLDYPESWKGPYTPFDVLKGALATEGHFTSAATSREITLSTFAIQRERVSQVRQRIIAELLSSLSNTNQRRAFLAAQNLANALRAPMAAQPGDSDPWGDEFLETLEKTDALLGTVIVTAPVLVRVAESVSWHALYGPERTRPTARRIFAHLDRDLETRTTRAFMDAWGTNTWPIEENVGRPQHDADVNALCSELGARYSEPAQLAQFLHDRLEDIGQANGSPDHGAARLFLARLLESNLPLARYLVQEHLRGKNSQLSPHTGCALSFLLMGAREETSTLIDSMLARDDTHLQVVAEGYLFATNLAPYSALDLRALRRIFASHDGPILRYTPHITHEVARNDKRLAIELITSVDVDCALRYARDFFMWIVHEDTIPFEMIHDDQLRRLVDGLRHTTRLDEYWTNDFLKKAIRRVPDSVIELAKTRIEDAIASGDWGMQPLGGVLGGRDALDLISLSEGREILRGLLDWARGRIGDYAFSYHFAELIEALCSPYDAACVAALEDWLAGGTDEQFKVITAIVREAGPRFVYSHEGFIARVLKAARSVGRTTHRDLSSAIFAASVSGARSGAPGQPFPFDLELKAMSEQRLALLAKSDPAFELYRELRDYAAREIERQLEEGRRMDEEDADA
ncbi:helix-turn-helix domain-containing protein [Ralstonia insidiosa]|uniref:helix-turn-helix domain-containing protein n=1 Tax=Ralstonia insidiosa TaxID=190721 RepID=UPI001427AB34|nr:helix-turn-helix domain-containing protein [Ralstonia insidiosa]